MKLSVMITGRRRIISLEEAFLRALKEIAARQATSLLALIAAIDAGRKRGNLSSAIRLFVLDFYREQLDGGPRRAPIKVTLERSIYDLH